MEEVTKAAQLMGCDADFFVDTFMKPKLKVGKDFVKKGQNKDQVCVLLPTFGFVCHFGILSFLMFDGLSDWPPLFLFVCHCVCLSACRPFLLHVSYVFLLYFLSVFPVCRSLPLRLRLASRQHQSLFTLGCSIGSSRLSTRLWTLPIPGNTSLVSKHKNTPNPRKHFIGW